MRSLWMIRRCPNRSSVRLSILSYPTCVHMRLYAMMVMKHWLYSHIPFKMYFFATSLNSSLIKHQVQWFHFHLALPFQKTYPYSPFIILVYVEFLLGSFLIHPFLVHVPIYGVIVSECISKWGLNHIRQTSFGDFAIKHSKELVASCLSSLLHSVHELRQQLFSLLTEFMSVPLVLEISLVPCFSSYDDISFDACRIDNSLICLACLAFHVFLNHQGS